MEWEIIITPQAEKQLAAISDRRVRQGIEKRFAALETDPERKGKALIDDHDSWGMFMISCSEAATAP